MRNKKSPYSPFKERLQTRRLTSGTIRRETRVPEAPKAHREIVLARAA
jgi:hypothetical protein